MEMAYYWLSRLFLRFEAWRNVARLRSLLSHLSSEDGEHVLRLLEVRLLSLFVRRRFFLLEEGLVDLSFLTSAGMDDRDLDLFTSVNSVHRGDGRTSIRQ